MAFVDELLVHIKAGKGGDGVVRWRHEKFVPKGGPAGGNGGDGGDVWIQGVKDSGILQKYKFKKEFSAEDGGIGKKSKEHGADGEDLIIDLPMGSIIRNVETKEEYELEEEGQRIKILRGGEGGFGNDHFKSSTNQTPKKKTKGKEGQKGDFYIEMQLLADIGLIGLPNVGKSSLLNSLTNSHSKVGNFNFTTLDPYLGDFHGTIIADIPGLIQGASFGKGLGHKFLRHIKRTKALFHCISAESEDLKKDYDILREELKNFDPNLLEKDETILITKVDIEKGFEKVKKAKEVFKGHKVIPVSILDDELLKELKSYISTF
jgi:GTP-binding protein